jgi:hypothetical protein
MYGVFGRPGMTSEKFDPKLDCEGDGELEQLEE